MKNATIALIAIPVMLAVSSLSFADSENSTKGWEKKHSKENYRGKHGQRNPEKMLKKLTEKLGLSEQQQAEVKALLEQQKETSEAGKTSRKALHEAIRNLNVNDADYQQQLEKVKSQAGLAAQAKIEKMMSFKQGMAGILDEAQLEKLEKFGNDKKSKRGNNSNN